MLTKEELEMLTNFCLSRPLDGLNLLQAQRVIIILEKLHKGTTEQKEGE